MSAPTIPAPSCATPPPSGWAATAGPGRAGRLALLLTADLLLFPPIPPPPGPQPTAALLNLLIGTSQELDMDELTDILETIQRNILSEATELVFGHVILPEAEDAGLQAWLLVGYGAERPTAVPTG